MTTSQIVKVTAAGGGTMSRQSLRGLRWSAPFTGVRVPRADAANLATRCAAILAVAPNGSVVSGLASAALRGWWLADPTGLPPIDITVPPGLLMRRRAVRCRRGKLGPADVESVFGVLTTSATRTLLDLAAETPLIDLVVLADSALFLGHCTIDDLAAAAGRRRIRGIRRFRQMLGLIEPRSESPMETLLRLIIVMSGLPRPLAQVELRGPLDEFLARADLTTPDGLSVFEFDGQHHDEASRHAGDVRRWRGLRGAGFEVFPYTAVDVFQRPQQIVADYQRALGRPEEPWLVKGWLTEWRLSGFAQRRRRRGE